MPIVDAGTDPAQLLRIAAEVAAPEFEPTPDAGDHLPSSVNRGAATLLLRRTW